MAGEARVIEWSHDPTDSRVGMACAYVTAGVFGGLVLFVVSMFVLAVAFAVAGGNLFALGFVVLLTLVGGPVSLLYLWPLLRHPKQRPSVPDWLAEFRPQWVLLTSLFGALAIVLSTPSGFFFAPIAVGFASMVGLALFTGEGEIETDTRTVRHGYSTEIELDGLTGVKRFCVAGIVLSWLSFPHGQPPRLLVLPSETDRAARPVFKEAAAQPAEARNPNRTVQATLVALTLAFFSVPVILAVSGSVTTEGAAIVGYVAVFFGIVFTGAAVYGTSRRATEPDSSAHRTHPCPRLAGGSRRGCRRDVRNISACCRRCAA